MLGGHEQDGPLALHLPVGVLTQNVCGLRDPLHGPAKLRRALAMADAAGVAIAIVTETGLSRKLAERQVREADVRYSAKHSCHPDAETNAHHGSGVTILVREEVTGYMVPVREIRDERCDGYGLRRDFQTPGGGRLVVLGVYMPHDPAAARTVQRWVVSQVREARRGDHDVIVAGDLNPFTSAVHRGFADQLAGHGLVDAAEHVGQLEETFSRPRTAADGTVGRPPGSRLDRTLVSIGLAQDLRAEHVLVDRSMQRQVPAVAGDHMSDHAALVVCSPAWGRLFDRALLARIREAMSRSGRKVVDIGRADEHARSSYAADVADRVAKSGFRASVDASDLDGAWAALSRSVDAAIASHLPTRTVGGAKSARARGAQRADALVVAYGLLDRWGRDKCRSPLPAAAGAQLPEELTGDLIRCEEDLAGVDADDLRLRDRKRLRKRFLNAIVELRNAADAATLDQRVRDKFDTVAGWFESDVGRLLSNVLERTRPPSQVDHVGLDEGGTTTEPEAVVAGIAAQVQPWFNNDAGAVRLDQMPERWQRALDPIAGVGPAVWGGLMEPMTRAELAEALAASAQDKSPGASGHTLRLYGLLVDHDGHGPLLDLLNLCLRRRGMPAQWRQGLIYLIPKTKDGFRGMAEGTRPITLLETLSKLLMKVLLIRIYGVLGRVHVLRGACHSGLPGTDTGVPIAVLNAAAHQARFRQSSLYAYFEDKSKAFDTVPHGLLRLCLRRLHLPDSFISFYFDGVLTGRTARVLTAFGPSNVVTIHRGIPQGAVESPFMFNVFYDVLICTLNEQFPGVTIDAHAGIRFNDVVTQEEVAAPPDAGAEGAEEAPAVGPPPARRRNVSAQTTRTMLPPHRVLGAFRVTAVAYMDDAVFYATSREELQQVMDVVGEFNAVARVRANAAKGAVLALERGRAVRPDAEQLVAAGAAVPWVPTAADGGFRYLGVWVDATYDGAAGVVAAGRELSRARASLHRRRLPPKVVAYILNSVIAPALLYRTRVCIPQRWKLERWEKTMRTLVRNALGGSCRLPMASLHMTALCGLTLISDQLVSQHVTELSVMLSQPASTAAGAASRSLVGLLQAATRCPVSPLADPDQALDAWEPVANKTVCGFDQLIPMLRARKMAIADERGEFHLGGADQRVPVNRHFAPLVCSARKDERFSATNMNGVLMLSATLTPQALLRTPAHDLWAALRAVTINATWVRGHSGVDGNERADVAAGAAAAPAVDPTPVEPQVLRMSELPGRPLAGDPRRFVLRLAEAEFIARFSTSCRSNQRGGALGDAIDTVRWDITERAMHGGCAPRYRRAPTPRDGLMAASRNLARARGPSGWLVPT